MDFSKGKFGKKAIINSGWKDKYLDMILGNDIVELELNDGKGWISSELDFLEKLGHLISFSIIDFGIKDIMPIHYLKNLEELHVSTYCESKIDFSVFPSLKECSFEWRKGSESIFQCRSVHNLFINNYSSNGEDNFQNFSNLEVLGLLNSSIKDFESIGRLKKLKSIRFGNLKNLSTLDWIKNLIDLEEVVFQRCRKIEKLDDLFGLFKLLKVHIINCDKIQSIQGIEHLQNLEEFLFYESTNVLDGDLKPLMQLPKLKKVSFQNRRHYNHKVQDFI